MVVCQLSICQMCSRCAECKAYGRHCSIVACFCVDDLTELAHTDADLGKVSVSLLRCGVEGTFFAQSQQSQHSVAERSTGRNVSELEPDRR